MEPYFEFKKIQTEHDNFLCAYNRGFFRKEDGSRYYNQLIETIKDITPEEYILIVDSGTDVPTEKSALPLLEKCSKVLYDTPFKKKYYIKPKGVYEIGLIQKMRIDDLGLFDQFVFIDSMEQILKRGL